jgi:hypothetical protein
MVMLKKFVEGKNTSWVVNLNKQIDDYPLYMDATRIIEDAIKRDIRHGYKAEYGPCYGIEAQRINEYVNYVSDKLNRENFFKFDTRYYRFFLGSVPVRKSAIGV